MNLGRETEMHIYFCENFDIRPIGFIFTHEKPNFYPEPRLEPDFILTFHLYELSK